MRVFIDANVLVAVLNKEYPLFTDAARVMSLAEKSPFELFLTPLSLAIGFYFSSKKCGEIMARQKLAVLCQHIKTALVTDEVVWKSLSDNRIYDFEDGMQYYAAADAGCRCIVTENKEDFYFSELEILNCQEFLIKYFTKKGR